MGRGVTEYIIETNSDERPSTKLSDELTGGARPSMGEMMDGEAAVADIHDCSISTQPLPQQNTAKQGKS